MWNWCRFEKPDEHIFVKFYAAVHPKQKFVGWNYVMFNLGMLDQGCGNEPFVFCQQQVGQLTQISDVYFLPQTANCIVSVLHLIKEYV